MNAVTHLANPENIPWCGESGISTGFVPWVTCPTCRDMADGTRT